MHPSLDTIPADKGRGRSTTWTGHQSQGSTDKDKQPHTLGVLSMGTCASENQPHVHLLVLYEEACSMQREPTQEQGEHERPQGIEPRAFSL